MSGSAEIGAQQGQPAGGKVVSWHAVAVAVAEHAPAFFSSFWKVVKGRAFGSSDPSPEATPAMKASLLSTAFFSAAAVSLTSSAGAAYAGSAGATPARSATRRVQDGSPRRRRSSSGGGWSAGEREISASGRQFSLSSAQIPALRYV